MMKMIMTTTTVRHNHAVTAHKVLSVDVAACSDKTSADVRVTFCSSVV